MQNTSRPAARAAGRPHRRAQQHGSARSTQGTKWIIRQSVLALVAAMQPIGAVRAQSLTPAARASASSRGASTTGAHDQEALDSLVAQALVVNPTVRAATARVEAAHARIGPATSWSDPMLMAGIQNLPLGKEPPTTSAHGEVSGSSGPDPMTMRMIGVTQTIPYPGKLSLRKRVAEREVDAASATLDAARRQVTRDVKDAYYELAFLDQALAIVERNQSVLASFIRLTEMRYGVGGSSGASQQAGMPGSASAGIQDVLKARVEATRLGETAVALNEQRRAALAQLNALLDRPSDTPVRQAEIPVSIARAAVADSARDVRFVSAALGARAADSPLPPVVELQELAIRESPALREQDAMIAAQATRLELTRTDVLPDFDVSLQYGQRPDRPDMVTATVSVPLPTFKRRKQDQMVAESGAQLAAVNAERAQRANDIRSEVARLVSELERSRAQLALYVKGVLPQSRAAVAAATSSYQTGKVEFLTVLDDQATVFNYETEYFRALTDFAKNLAELERIVWKEVLR